MNLAFDVTPAKYVLGLITEKGVCEASEAMHYKRCLNDKKYFDIYFIVLGMVIVILNFSDHNLKRAVDACLAGSQKLSKSKITDLT